MNGPSATHLLLHSRVVLPGSCGVQFGGMQRILINVNTGPKLHAIDLRGKFDIDWAIYYAAHIEEWNQRLE